MPGAAVREQGSGRADRDVTRVRADGEHRHAGRPPCRAPPGVSETAEASSRSGRTGFCRNPSARFRSARMALSAARGR